MPPEPALVAGLPASKFAGLRRKLCQAIAAFEDNTDTSSDAASLIQVWLPETTDNGIVLLRTRGLPFAVAGVGDLIALFRCISCRYNFSTTTNAPDLLGAPGRVFATGEPEFLSDVQKCSKAVYMRTTEAAQCNVRSVLLLPLFGDPQRSTTVGVVEVAQSTDKMPFDNVVTALSVALKDCDLYLCEAAALQKEMEMALIMNVAALKLCCKESKEDACAKQERRLWPDAAAGAVIDAAVTGMAEESPVSAAVGPPGPGWHLLSAPLPSAEDGLPAASDSAPDARTASEAVPTDAMALPQHEPSSQRVDREVGDTVRRGAQSGKPRRRGEGAGGGRGSALRLTSLTALVEGADADDGGMGGSEDASQEDGGGDGSEDEPPSGIRRKTGHGTTGKPGKRLTLEDLQSHFGVSLQEAAASLGICATTLKRACRRHGIQRWPRRPSQKARDAHAPNGWMPVSWFGNGPGIPGSCFPSMASMGSMDGSMRGGNLFGGPPRPPQPFGSPDGSVHGATLAQQASTGGDGSGHSGTLVSGALASQQAMPNGHLQHASSQDFGVPGFGQPSQMGNGPAFPAMDMPMPPGISEQQQSEFQAEQQRLQQMQQQQHLHLQQLQQQYYQRWYLHAQHQSAQLAAKQQAEQADTSARLAALEQERAALQAKLAAEKARASEALTLEQLRQQHNERWWFTKQESSAADASHDAHAHSQKSHLEIPMSAGLALNPPSSGQPQMRSGDVHGTQQPAGRSHDLAFCVDQLFPEVDFDHHGLGDETLADADLLLHDLNFELDGTDPAPA